MSPFCSLFSTREQMKSLQEALQNQLKETSEKAEKQQATVSVFLFWVCRFGAGKLFYLLFFCLQKSPWNKHICKT